MTGGLVPGLCQGSIDLDGVREGRVIHRTLQANEYQDYRRIYTLKRYSVQVLGY